MTTLLQAVRTPLLVVAVVLTGLQAGLYLAFATGVMPGLAHVDDRTFVATVRAVNVAIVNPLFLLTFVGAPLVAVLAAVATPGPARPWVVAGAVLAVLTLVVTGAVNVPLNDALAAVGPDGDAGALASARSAFEAPWVRWNVVRTATSTSSLALLVLAATRR